MYGEGWGGLPNYVLQEGVALNACIFASIFATIQAIIPRTAPRAKPWNHCNCFELQFELLRSNCALQTSKMLTSAIRPVGRDGPYGPSPILAEACETSC